MHAIASQTECATCKATRRERCRVLQDLSAIPEELHQAPYSSAPALYSSTLPPSPATLVRAREFAKQADKQLCWFDARDVPLHPNDRELPAVALEKKMLAWLRRHDQHTSNLTSLLPLVTGLPIRLTDCVDRERQLYRGRRGFIYVWTSHEECQSTDVGGEFLLDRMPLRFY